MEPIKIIDVTPQQTVFDYLMQPSTLIALFAILISVVSIILSVCFNRKTLKMTETHNALSVKPLVNVDAVLKNNQFTILLANHGIGPAIIRSLKFFYKNECFNQNIAVLLDALIDSNNLAENLLSIKDECVMITKDHTIGLDQNVTIYKSFKESEDILNYHKLFEDIVIKVEYTDIYNNEFVYNQKIIDIKSGK